MKKLLVLVFAIALCLGVLCVGASAVKYDQNGFGDDDSYEPATQQNGVYQIGNAGQLYWFAEQVNSGTTNINAVLTADITINTGVLKTDGSLNNGSFAQWTPIGNNSNRYTGTFDGNNKTISGLYYSGSGNYVGLFGCVGSGGVVKDVSVADSYIGVTTTSENALYIGGISGHNEGHLEGCTFTGTLTAEQKTTNNVYSYAGGISGSNIGTIERCINYGKITGGGYNPIVGGICGGDYNTEVMGTIKNCENNGAVTSITIGGDGNTCVAGGILGDGLSKIEGCHNSGSVLGANYAGGIVGRSKGETITDCTNSAEVMAYYQYAGGICGNASDTVSISECINSGSIEINDTSAKGFTGLGGICGGVSKPSTQISIVNCYNSGDLIGSQHNSADKMYIGGIFGRVPSSAHYIYIRNCCNAGTITCNSSIGEVNTGGVCGMTTSGGSESSFKVLKVEHCFWLDRDGTGDEDTGAMTAERFERGEAAGSLNGWTYDEYNGKVWKVGEDGYPVLAGGSNDVFKVTFVDSNNNTLMTCCTNNNDTLKGIGSIYFGNATLTIGDDIITGSDLLSETFDRNTTISVVGYLGYKLTATVEGSASKAYDGSNAVTDASDLSLELSGIKADDDVSVSSVEYVFDSAEAGKRNITVDSVTLAGEDADNYVLSATEVSGSVGTITKKTLTPSISGTVTKVYNGTTDVPVGHGLSITLEGVVGNDEVSATAAYAFDDVNVGENKTITATGITLTGAAADNYVLSSSSVSDEVGTITKKTLIPSISGTVSKVYDGTTGVPAGHGLSIALKDVIDGESVSATAVSYVYGDANVGQNKTIIATGITLSGTDADNYVLSATTVSGSVGTITKKTLTPSISGTVTKVYDGTKAAPEGLSIALEGVVSGDDVTATATCSFEDANVGNGKAITASNITLTGDDAGKYVLRDTTAETYAGEITPRTVTIIADDKTAKRGEDMPVLTYTANGFIGGDTMTLEPELSCYADMTVAGTYEITVSGGSSSSNYTLAYQKGTLTVNNRWLVTVKYGNDDADVSSYVEPGSSFKLPDAPSKSGYYFVGWSDGNTTYKAGAMVENITADTTFTAVWREINIPDPNGITVTQPENGTVKVNPSNGSAGTLITVTATPDEGYELAYITVDGEKITGNTFKMPDKAVTVSAVFVPIEFPFTDVKSGDWFYDYVAYVYSNGLMDGTSATTFEPNANMTRAMVWAILARIDGETVTGAAWATDARAWAMAEGVSDGTDPNGLVTREQFATMLYRYAVAKGYDVSIGESTNILSYADFASISEYAIPAMQWACGSGIVTGVTDTTLVPQGTATRAQCAAMLMRFAEL